LNSRFARTRSASLVSKNGSTETRLNILVLKSNSVAPRSVSFSPATSGRTETR